MKRLLWWLLAGTRGGVNRARIIRHLHKRPSNANQIAEALEMDYKTVRHHIKVLEENDIVVSESFSKSRYGAVFFLSNMMEGHMDEFNEIWDQIG